MAAGVPQIKLNNGRSIPALGLGTWQGPRDLAPEAGNAVREAIDIGFRHIDCAYAYGNEKYIGEAIRDKIKEGVVKREDLFIVSKLWITVNQPEKIEEALRGQLKDLQLDYLDLYLMHYPFAVEKENDAFADDPVVPSSCDYVNRWKAMEEVYKKGLAKSIGISNFNSRQIERLLKSTTVVPAINQIECHPYLNQTKLRKFCKDKGIAVAAYSPLGSPSRPGKKPEDPDLFTDSRVKQIAAKYNKSIAQVLLRYNFQLGNVVVSKSSIKNELLENINIFDFELNSDDMKYIDTFNCNWRIFPYTNAINHPFYPFSEEF